MALFFRDIFGKDDGWGYKTSESAPDARRDIGGGDMFSKGAAGLTDMFGAKAGTSASPTTIAQQALESITNPAGTSQAKSIMSTVLPNRTYAAAEVSGQARSANKQVTDGSKVSNTLGQAKQQNEQTISQFKQDFKDLKAEVTAALKEAAQNAGHDPSVAVDSMMAKQQTTMADAAVFVGGEIAAGGLGSMITATTKGAYITMSASQSDKKLKPEEQQKLMEDTLKTLQSAPRAPQATQGSVGGAASPLGEGLGYSRFDWQSVTPESLKEIMDADPSGETQPEMQKLRNAQNNIQENGMDDLASVKRHYAHNNVGEKIGEVHNDDTLDYTAIAIAGMNLLGIGKMSVSDLDAESLDVDDVKEQMPKIKPPEYVAALEQNVSSQMQLS